MKYLDEFERYKPRESDIDKWIKIIDSEYEVKVYHGEKIVVVDDKINWLSGNFQNKGLLVNRIFNDIDSKYPDTHEPSLRRAIKNWIDSK